MITREPHDAVKGRQSAVTQREVVIGCHVPAEVILDSSTVVSSVNDIDPNAKAPRAKMQYHPPKPKIDTNREDGRLGYLDNVTATEEEAALESKRCFENSFSLKA